MLKAASGFVLVRPIRKGLVCFFRKFKTSGPELFSQLRELFLFPDKMFKYNIALIHCSKVVGKALGLAERPSFL